MLGDGGEYDSIVPVEYSRGMVGSFLSVGSSYKPSHPSLYISIGARHIKEYFKNKRWRKRKLIQPHQ